MKLGKRTARLVREAAVMGFVQGQRYGRIERDEDYPKDSFVTALVLRSVKSFPDLYPFLSKVEIDPTTGQPKPATPAPSEEDRHDRPHLP